MSHKTNETTIVKMPEKLGFMTFSMSSNIVFNFKGLFYLIFLTNILKVPIATAGMISALGIVWDAVNDPLIGVWTANHTFKNGEKVRPFALYCCVPWAVTIVLLFAHYRASVTVITAIELAVYFVFEALYTFLCMPYNSMGSLASPYDADRKSINAFRSLGGCLGSGIGTVAVTPLVKLFGGLPGQDAILGGHENDARAVFLTACVMGVLCIVGSLAHYFTTQERVKPREAHEEKVSLVTAYKMLFKCRSWVLNMFYVICYGILCSLVMQNINYYAAYILGSSAAATPILAVYLAVSIVFSILTPKIDSILGRRATMLGAAAVLIIGKIPFLIDPYSLFGIYTNALTVGIGTTVTFIMFNTNRNNVADIVEWKNGRRLDSMVAAGENLASKLAEAGVVELMSLSLAAAGFDAALGKAQTPETLSTICNLLGWIPFGVSVLMLLLLLKLDVQKEMDECRPKD